MRNTNYLLYILTLFCVSVLIYSISLLQSKDSFDILVKLQIFDKASPANLKLFLNYVLALAVFTCFLLVLSFLSLLPKNNNRNSSKE